MPTLTDQQVTELRLAHEQAREKRLADRIKAILSLYYIDKASHHRSKQVALWLKRHRRFKALFLPAYSPNLNLIERLWRFFHTKVAWNRYFETFKEFRRVTLRFFKNMARYGPELDKLLTDNFQLIPNLTLQT